MIRALVLDFDPATRIAACYNRDQDVLLRAKLDGEVETLRGGQFLVFDSTRTANDSGLIDLGPGTFEIDDPAPQDCIVFERNDAGEKRFTIRSWIGFSPNKSALTYSRKVGYTDWYGFIDCNESDFQYAGVYAVNITVNDLDYIRNGTKLFKIVENTRKKYFAKNLCADKLKFLEKLEEFEKARDGLGSEKMMENKKESEVSAIILTVEAEANIVSCFCEQLEAVIRVKLPETTLFDKGQRLIFHEFECENDIYSPVVKDGLITIQDDPQVHFDNGELLINSQAVCSTNIVHSTFSKEIAFAGDFGYVAAENVPEFENGVVYNVDLALKSCRPDTADNTIFKIYRIKDKADEVTSEHFLKMLQKSENARLGILDSEMEEIVKNMQENLTVNEDKSTVNRALEAMGRGDREVDSDDSEDIVVAQPSSSQRSNPAMDTKMKQDLEMSVLVLHVDDGVGYGFETFLMKLFRFDLHDVPARLAQFGTLTFIADDSTSGKVTIKKFIEYLPPKEHPVMETFIAFSSNSHHRSYDKSVAVSDKYGFVQIPNTISTRELRDMTVYKTSVDLIQYENPQMPVFGITRESPLENVARDESFIGKVLKFEERYFNNSKELSTTLPKFSQPKPVSKKGKFSKPERTKLEGHSTALVLEVFDSVRNKTYGTVWTLLGDAILKCPAVDISTGNDVRKGDWVMVRLEYFANILYVTKIVQKEIHQYPVNWRRDGTLIVTGNLAINKPINEQNVRFYNHSLLGLVQADESVYERTSEQNVKVEFEKLNPSRRVDRRNVCYWYATRVNEVPHCSTSNFSKPKERLEDFDFSNEYDMKKDFPPSPKKEQYDEPKQYNPQSSSSSSLANRQFDNPQPSLYQKPAFSQQLYEEHPSARMSVSSRSTITHDDEYGSAAIVTGTFDDTYSIVFLHQKGYASRMDWRNVRGPTVSLGQAFECHFRNINGPQFFFEVTKIIRTLDQHNEVKIEGGECLCLFKINMCNMEKRFHDQLKYGGCWVFMSEEVGYVVANERVRDATGAQKSIRELSETYKGDRKAEKLVGWFRYVRCEVPRMMVDRDYPEGDEMVTTYAWRLEAIEGTIEQYQRKQQNLMNENLGSNSHQLEEDDDIARQKKRAHEQFERQQTRASADSGRYLRTDGSVSNFATPNGSLYGRDMGSSNSYYSAQGSTSANRGGEDYFNGQTNGNFSAKFEDPRSSSSSYRYCSTNSGFEYVGGSQKSNNYPSQNHTSAHSSVSNRSTPTAVDNRIVELEEKLKIAHLKMTSLCNSVEKYTLKREHFAALKECSVDDAGELDDTNRMCRAYLMENRDF